MAQAGHHVGSTCGTRMDLVAKALLLRAVVVGVMAGALFLAGCGGGSKAAARRAPRPRRRSSASR